MNISLLIIMKSQTFQIYKQDKSRSAQMSTKTFSILGARTASFDVKGSFSHLRSVMNGENNVNRIY